MAIGIPDGAAKAARQLYHPFGKTSWEQTYDITLTEEDKGFLPLS